MGITHYMLEVSVSDKSYLFKLREELLKSGCIARFDGDLGVFYAVILQCRSEAIVIIGYSGAYYIDVLVRAGGAEKYLNLIVTVFPKTRIAVHTVLREL